MQTAEGLSNQAIGRRLFLSESAVGKYTTSLSGKLGITDDDDTNRRVRAVLTYLHGPGGKDRISPQPGGPVV